MGLRTNGSVEDYMPFWTKERETAVWGFNEKIDSSQVDEKEQTIVK